MIGDRLDLFANLHYRDPTQFFRIADASDQLDPFDRVQLALVVETCRTSRSLSEAGRALFAASRARRSSSNDADRLRKYLARFGLDWGRLAN